MHHIIVPYYTAQTCARHPEDVHRERETIYRYKHSPNHCPSPMLYLAQMPNQHRWRADANSDQSKHSGQGRGSLQWNTIGPAKPHSAVTCAVFLCSFNVFSYILRILVWKANLKRMTWDHRNQLSWAAPLNTHTHSPEGKIFSVARREICHGQALFSLSHCKHRAAIPLPPHLDRRASAQPRCFASFLLINGFMSAGGFSYRAKLKRSSQLHWPTTHCPQRRIPSQEHFSSPGKSIGPSVMMK